MNQESDNITVINNYEKFKDNILFLYKTYDYLNLKLENFEMICNDIINRIYKDNKNISDKKATEILENSLDKYVKSKLSDSRKIQKIINDFIKVKVQVHDNTEENLEELRKINNFLTRYKVEETPELYSELLNNLTIDKIIKTIIQTRIDKIDSKGLIVADKNYSIQLLLEMYCEKNQISFKNTYQEIAETQYDSDMAAKNIDGFGLYLSQIAKPLLTKEEEQMLFILKEQGDQIATEKLIEHNLQLVVHIAKSYIGKGLDILDLVQEGNRGLINAIERFDYKKGYKLSTYATWWIRQSIQRGIMNNARTIRLPIHLHEKINKYNITLSRLIAQLKREPTRKEICEELKITEAQLTDLEIANQEVISMNILIGDKDESDATIEDFIAEPYNDIETEWFKKILSEEIREMLNQTNLTTRERMVIIRRFGLNGEKPKTLNEIAIKLGLTRERIRQIEAKALRKIKTSPYIKNLAVLANRPEGKPHIHNTYDKIKLLNKKY